MKVVSLELSGLSCGGCISTVKAALENAGAEVDKITLNEAKIRIREDEEVEKFIEAVKRVGYGARLKA